MLKRKAWYLSEKNTHTQLKESVLFFFINMEKLEEEI